MKIRTCAALLLAVLVIIPLSGCSLWTMEARLDALEDKMENRADAVEDSVESAIIEAIRPDPVPLAPAPTQPAETSPAETTPVETVPAAPQTTAAMLTEEEAEAIALEYAGFSKEQVSYLWTEYEIDDGIPQYDIQFHEGYWEYELEIHAETGNILSFDKDD